MTLELCNGTIVLKAAAMLHAADAEFAIIDSAHYAKNRRNYPGTFLKILRYLSSFARESASVYYCSPGNTQGNFGK